MNIPPPILEASNGMLWVVLMFAALGAAWWLVGCVRQVGSLKRLYLEEKASLALFLTFGSLSLRSANVWWMQHLRNHDRGLPAWDGVPTAIHVICTLLALIGIMCWLRCTMPSHYFGWRGWMIALMLAFSFGVLMAL